VVVSELDKRKYAGTRREKERAQKVLKAIRALGRIVHAEPGGGWTASYRLVVREDGDVERASFTSATAARKC
jgi:hypothetical protein